MSHFMTSGWTVTGSVFTLSSFAVGTIMPPDRRRLLFIGICLSGGIGVGVLRSLQLSRSRCEHDPASRPNTPEQTDGPAPDSASSLHAAEFVSHSDLRLLRCANVSRGAPFVFVTRHRVEVETLERKSQVRAICITCQAGNWDPKLTNALTQATGKRTFARSVARIQALRRSVSRLAIFASGCVPHPDVFVAYFAAQILQIGMVAGTLCTCLGYSWRDAIDYYRDQQRDWNAIFQALVEAFVDLFPHPVLSKAVLFVMTVKETLTPVAPTPSVIDAVKAAPTLIATLIPDHIKTGCLVGAQGLVISAALLSTASRLWHNSPLCETAAWSARTHTPFGIVLLIDYEASKETPLDVYQLNRLVGFIVSKVPLAVIVQHNLTVRVNEGATRNVAVVPAHSLLMMIGTAAGHFNRYMATRQALADGSIGLAAVISELRAAGDDDKTIMLAAGYAPTSKPKESVEAMVKGICRDAAEKYQRLEERAATYSRERVAVIVDRLRRAGWTNDRIAYSAGYADGNVDTLLTGDPEDVQSRYTALRRMVYQTS
jgi:hypothetical protein